MRLFGTKSRGKGQPGNRAVSGGGVRSPGIVNTGWGGYTVFGIQSLVPVGEEVAGGGEEVPVDWVLHCRWHLCS